MRRELLQSILDEAERLNRLVANLLDMTRLEAGALEVRKEWQPIEEIVGAALGRMARQLEDHPVATHLRPDLPFVPMDDLLIQQVLVNLLENAAKYSPPGTPIEVSATPTTTSLVVEVADRGPGLPPADLQRVFEKFYRAATSTGRPGAGWGWRSVAASSNCTAAQIEAENRPGGGAVFRFSLPLGGAQPAIPADETAAQA